MRHAGADDHLLHVVLGVWGGEHRLERPSADGSDVVNYVTLSLGYGNDATIDFSLLLLLLSPPPSYSMSIPASCAIFAMPSVNGPFAMINNVSVLGLILHSHCMRHKYSILR